MKVFVAIALFIGLLSSRMQLATAHTPAGENPQDTYGLVQLFGYPPTPSRAMNPSAVVFPFLLSDGRLLASQTGALTLYSADGLRGATIACSEAVAAELSGQRLLVFCAGVGLQLRDTNFNVLSTVAVSGNNPGQVQLIRCLSVRDDDSFVASDIQRGKVVEFGSNLSFQREWGSVGQTLGSLSQPFCARNLSDGSLVVADTISSRTRLSRYSANGDLLALISQSVNGSDSDSLERWAGFNVLNDRILHPSSNDSAFVRPGLRTRLNVFDLTGNLVGQISASPTLFDFGAARAISVSRNGAIAIRLRLQGTTTETVGVFKPRYRALAGHRIGVPPYPVVVNVAPRPGTSFTEVSFRVNDPDSTTVRVRGLGFLGGTLSLANAVPIQSVVEGADALSDDVVTGVLHSFAWNAGADLGQSTGFAEMRIAMLADDGRPQLLELPFVHLPPLGGDPELVISTIPVSNLDLMEAWYWLIADDDPEISFSRDGVLGAAPPFTGQLLASGTTTTAMGRQFLFQRMQLREATAGEVARARAATTPGVQQYTPINTAGNRPVAVNEVGVDTGATEGYWVVPVM